MCYYTEPAENWDYENQPHEIEARESEQILYDLYMEYKQGVTVPEVSPQWMPNRLSAYNMGVTERDQVDYRFKGGIQNGTVATDARARKLDEQCKHQKEDVFTVLKEIYPHLTLQKKLSKDQIPGLKGACEPDGGAWFYRGVLIAVFEGKKQQDRGNAIERWFKKTWPIYSPRYVLCNFLHW